MSTSARLRVRILPDVWDEEVGRLAATSAARRTAEHERAAFDREGLDLRVLQRCAAHGADGTQLAGLVKVYVPIGDRPPSQRPYGFVFDPDRDAAGAYLDLMAFGERHPERPATRSVYERAHRRLHGRYPSG